MKILEGHRTHLAHLQFHAYGGHDWGSMKSEAVAVAEEFNRHKNLTCDVGAILFGDAVTITADGPWQHLLYELTGRKWANLDVENETGCGIVPYVYSDHHLVNSVQWAVGLELMLLITDPWRVYLTTDHPNGGGFWRYPEIVRLLMDAEFRKSEVRKLPVEAQKRITLAELDREYTFSDIAILTSAGPARALGLKQKGQLGIGADGDITIYPERPDKDGVLFAYPRYVLKGGKVVVEEGQVRAITEGREFISRPKFDDTIEAYIRPEFQKLYTMSFENYPTDIERMHQHDIVECEPQPGTSARCRLCPRPHLQQGTNDYSHAEKSDRPRAARSGSHLSGRDDDAQERCDSRAAGLPGQETHAARRLLRPSKARPATKSRFTAMKKVRWVGRGMSRGRINIVGNVGMHLGAYMKGGTIEVSGSSSDWVGGEMSGGLIRIAGNAGGQLGAAYRGSRGGMTNGTIIVGGSAGLEIGMRMKRGLIVIGGPVRDFTGLR